VQYVEETQYGVTPDNAVFVHAGPLVELTENVDIGSIKYRQIGSRDIYSLIKTGEMYSFELTFNPIDDALIKYGINLPGGTGTIEKSLTFIKSQKINDTEMFTLYKGCRCDSIDVEVTNDGAVEVTMTFLCREITTPSATHGLVTPTFASNPTQEPWTNLSPGSGPLTINAIAVDTPSWSMTVSNNLEVVKPNGELIAKFVEPTLRDISFEFDTWLKDTVLLADTKTLTPRAMEYKLSADRKLVFTDAYLESQETSDATSATESKIQSFSGTAKAVAVATY
jgi:hypothetical protein